MITIPQKEIEDAAHEYAGPGSGSISFTDLPSFVAGARWALDRLNNPKHKQAHAFVILNEGTKQVRLESGDMALWLAGDKSLAIELLKNEKGHNTTEVINSFLNKRCGEKFNGDSHLFNSFKKHWSAFIPEKHNSKKISNAHDEYFS